MSVFQTNIFVCEVCGHISATTVETSQYSDPVVRPPHDEVWEYVDIKDKELLACPLCVALHRIKD